jgi:predicted RNA-binding protein with PUA-like domain
MAGRWLLKTEPSEYSYADLVRDGGTAWDGVANAQALNYLRQIKKGDRLLIYHTGNEKAVVATARAGRTAYPDPARGDPRFVVVDVVPGRQLPQPVTLARIKADPGCTGWELVRLPRLSVMPVSDQQWQAIDRLAREP